MKATFRRVIPKTYKDVYRILVAYIRQYGGILEIAKSPYFHGSIFLSVLTFGIWTESGWWDLPIDILPSLISFTLAGYALFLALGNDTFRQMMVGEEDKISPLLSISATFVHFILIQTLALILAIIAKSHPISGFVGLINIASLNVGYVRIIRIFLCYIFWFVSYSAFLYSICCIIAITMSLFRVARWLNKHHLIQKKSE